MASEDKDLEDHLREVGSRLAAPPSAAEELLALLDQTEHFLSKVDQSPSQSMSSALRPAINALVAKDLLEHPDIDVKVALASCVSEITRITAPDAPYDDVLMKVIFQMIVEAFEKLDDISSRSYLKRLSILETVAKVRSCVVMLDLECDDLILEMFHHFLKTIRTNHPENVFSSMELIMTLVLEESEDISSELLLCLLDSVKKNKEVLPIACRLGEKVISNCAVKLKPYLMQVQSFCSPDDYSKIVSSICQEKSDALEQNEINNSGEILADDSKLSERTVSDELPQGFVKTEQEAGSPEKGATADKSPKSVMSNGIVQRGDDNTMVDTTSPKQKPERSRHSDRSKNNVAIDTADSDNGVTLDTTIDLKTMRNRLRKANSSKKVTAVSEISRNDSDKEVPSVPSRKKGHSKEANTSLQVEGPSGNEAGLAVPQEYEERDDLQPPRKSGNGSVCISSPAPSEKVLDATRPKRGRPPGSKFSGKKGVNTVAELPASTSGDKGDLGNSQTHDESMPSEDNDFKKEPEAVSNSEGKSHKHRGKKIPQTSENVDDGERQAASKSDSEAKNLGKTGKREFKNVTKGESLAKKKSNIKQPKEKVTRVKDEAGELNLKDVPSSSMPDTNMQSKDDSHLEDSGKTHSGRKRVREEISETLDQKLKLDQSIVGCRIKIWWPDDKKFYDGAVDSFSPDTGKHKIVYDDGDVELLLLKDERYNLVEGGTETEVGTTKDDPNPIVSPVVLQNKKIKVHSDSALKKVRTQTPLKGGADASRHDSNSKKLKGISRGGSSKISKETAASKSEDDTPKTGSKIKGQGNKSNDGMTGTGTKDDIPASGSKPKDVAPKSGRKSKDGTPKTSSKVKGDTPKSGRKLTDGLQEETPKTVSKSKDESIGTGKKESGKIRSNQGAPKVGRKTKPKEFSADCISEKAKEKDQGSETPLKVGPKSETPNKAQESTAASIGKKRKSKVYK